MIFGMTREESLRYIMGFDKTCYWKFAFLPKKMQCGRVVWLQEYWVKARVCICRLYEACVVDHPGDEYTTIKPDHSYAKAMKL